jgi:hypothetical protein
MLTSTRVTRCGAVAFAGLTALSLAACGSSSTPSPSSSAAASASTTTGSTAAAAPSSPAPAAAAKDRAIGVVGTVAGGTITLTGPEGPGTVDVTASTHVTQLVTAQLTDVAAGQCLVVRPTKDTAGTAAVTAVSVLFGPSDGGQCAPPGRKGGRGVIGTVASVGGNTITVTTADNQTDKVTVTPDTRYAKRNIADPSVIAAGQCLMAQGTKAADGSLQATSVGIRPTDSGPCGGKRQG